MEGQHERRVIMTEEVKDELNVDIGDVSIPEPEVESDVEHAEPEEEESEFEEEESEDEEEESEDEEEESEDEEEVSEEEESEFTFDPKLKVMDEEIEVPEWIAKNVSSEEEAQYIKDLHEKAHGLESVKQKRDYFKNELQATQSTVSELNNTVKGQSDMFDFYDKLIQNKDMASFQHYAGIDDQTILDRAAEILRYQELTPTQKAEYDRNIQARQKSYDTEFQLNQLQSQQANNVVTERISELDNFLGQESYKEAVEGFDKRLGSGSFKSEVINRAALHEQRTGETLSIEEAVNQTIKIIGYPQGQSDVPEQKQEQANATSAQRTKRPQQTIVRKESKPTIPNMKSGNKSAAKPIVKSLADLRKLAEQQDY
jgi:hypothetical protein